MYSTTCNKPIFIDYGFSDIIKEKVGFKTLTSFQGTASYVSKEMLALFSVEDKQGYVDLYYNDLVCFQNSVEQIKKNTYKQQQKALNLIKDCLNYDYTDIETDNK